MLTKPLDETTEADLAALVIDGIPEGLRLDFKRELHLSTERQRLEVATDVASMANTAGGRVVFGIDERITDGTPVAGSLVPLTDSTLASTLVNVLHSIIVPAPHIDIIQVPLAAGGFILVVEIQRSWADVHMVSGYGKHRYSRRGPIGNVPMSEPEVREAYDRILKAKAELDVRERELTAPELEIRKSTDESVIVTALYGDNALLDPRRIQVAIDELRSKELRALAFDDMPLNLKITGRGYRCVIPWNATPEAAPSYLAILKGGLIHASYNLALRAEKADVPYDFDTFPATFRILRGLAVARLVLERGGYSGPVRVRYVLRSQRPFFLDRNRYGFYPSGEPETVAAGEYPGIPVDAELCHGSLEPLAKDLLAPIFHEHGRAAAPWFDDSGQLLDEHRKKLPAALLPLL